MINPKDFIKALKDSDLDFVVGVPDSLLKEFCSAITDRFSDENHIISANEGAAVGLAIGHFLATSKPALVYMQNSGIGNAINPLVSLADPLVYGIPMVLIIGWRGEYDGLTRVQVNDEPQHKKQGFITIELLETLGIPYEILGSDINLAGTQMRRLVEVAHHRSGPVALVVRKGTFSEYIFDDGFIQKSELTREDALKIIVKEFPLKTPIISTTGMASRELFEIRKFNQQSHENDFLTVGGMGHAISIAVGVAKSKRSVKVVCVDGDGSLLMHTGSLAVASSYSNIIHIVINNGAHDSVGGQPTLARAINLYKIAEAIGYKNSYVVHNSDELTNAIRSSLKNVGSTFIEVLCMTGARANLGRPTNSPQANKFSFMERLIKNND